LPFRWASIKGKIEIAVGLSKPSVIDSLEQGILMMILLSQKLLTKEENMYIAIEKLELVYLQKAVNELRENMIKMEAHDELFKYVTELDVRIGQMFDNSFVV
jgi:hypothetical protein